MFKRMCLAAFGLVVAGPGAAQELDHWKPAAVVGQHAEDVIAAPTVAEIMAASPGAKEGNAVARCAVDATGTLGNCRTIVERPAGKGFGAALASMAPRFRLKPDTSRTEGASVLIAASWPVPDIGPRWTVPPLPNPSISYPGAFIAANVPGRAILSCQLTKTGDLFRCVVIEQEPSGVGLGAMTLRFASVMDLQPAQLAGKPTPVGVLVTFRYQPYSQPPGAEKPPGS